MTASSLHVTAARSELVCCGAQSNKVEEHRFGIWHLMSDPSWSPPAVCEKFEKCDKCPLRVVGTPPRLAKFLLVLNTHPVIVEVVLLERPHGLAALEDLAPHLGDAELVGHSGTGFRRWRRATDAEP